MKWVTKEEKKQRDQRQKELSNEELLKRIEKLEALINK